jgi:acyl-coenzyme A thioesterase PaaI-like protein
LTDVEPDRSPFMVPIAMPARLDSEPGQTEAFVTLAAALRQLQNDLAAAAPTTAESYDIAAQLRQISATLAARHVDESQRIAGRVWNAPGKAQFLTPPYRWREISDDYCIGTVEFGQMYIGSGAVHGGAIPLVYDEIMGSLANRKAPARSRTVNLSVRYRTLTPVDVPLDFEVRFDREEGRKRFLSARMTYEGTVLSEAEGIFVILLPGQK